MSASDTTAVLRIEHQWILRVVVGLERLIAQAPDALDLDTVEKCIRFFRLFADACHHGKEEDLLFPELEARGFSRTSGPIAVMLYEHRLGREWVAKMAAALAETRQGDAEARERLIEAGHGYIDLIRGHIHKEDHVLFNMADRVVDTPACQRLCAGYDAVCARRFEGCTKAELEALADEIVEAASG